MADTITSPLVCPECGEAPTYMAPVVRSDARLFTCAHDHDWRWTPTPAAPAPAEAAGDREAVDALLAHCEVRASRTMEPRKSEWLRRAAAVRALAAWREAVLDAAVVGWTLTAEHERDPRAAVNALLAHAQQVALDPAVSAEARALTDAARTRFAEARDAAVRVLHDAITDTTSPCVAIGCTTCRRHRLHAALATASEHLTEPIRALAARTPAAPAPEADDAAEAAFVAAFKQLVGENATSSDRRTFRAHLTRIRLESTP